MRLVGEPAPQREVDDRARRTRRRRGRDRAEPAAPRRTGSSPDSRRRPRSATPRGGASTARTPPGGPAPLRTNGALDGSDGDVRLGGDRSLRDRTAAAARDALNFLAASRARSITATADSRCTTETFATTATIASARRIGSLAQRQRRRVREERVGERRERRAGDQVDGALAPAHRAARRRDAHRLGLGGGVADHEGADDARPARRTAPGRGRGSSRRGRRRGRTRRSDRPRRRPPRPRPTRAPVLRASRPSTMSPKVAQNRGQRRAQAEPAEADRHAGARGRDQRAQRSPCSA